MKKQNFQKKLVFRTTTISNVTNLNRIRGGVGGVAVRFTDNPCIISDVETCKTVTQEPIKLTEALYCTHTIGNGQDGNGNPCTY
ncbi:hypothetical protein H2O64_12835 [Kordia sp. YSTF-M3]|uniref:Uncharacterized protein n=1 Tax=Kordia aestuariivivens TaxID=2759037 RepID=A0ABR7QAI1_9FLAO|nr:hypothetical protein [Kordia aestuariivivens]MBC8755555.1 hypothetical protein [Kordia aestuariivivens]